MSWRRLARYLRAATAGGPRGWRRRGKERVKRRAAGAGADPPPPRAFHEVDARRGPAETDPGPRARRLPLTASSLLEIFPNFSSMLIDRSPSSSHTDVLSESVLHCYFEYVIRRLYLGCV